ncbi:MAG: peptide deformylase [Deltaproteobacteria bacterium]|nr:peptide deformylase [Deltaproteobacteria bacterium]
MAILDILKYPDPLLAQVSKPVEVVDEGIRELIADMFETMYLNDGVGLAAPQVGVLRRIIVVDVSPREDADGKPLPARQPIAVVNPVVESRVGQVTWEEGCLSVPGVSEEVSRAAEVVVTGLDEKGQPLRIQASGLLAICLQHEIDHLEGVLFVDRLSRLKQSLVKKRLKKRLPEQNQVSM